MASVERPGERPKWSMPHDAPDPTCLVISEGSIVGPRDEDRDEDGGPVTTAENPEKREIMTTDMGTGQRSLSMADHPDIKRLAESDARRADRTQAAVPFVHGLALLAGMYVAISPWVVGFQGQTRLAISDLLVGAAVVLLTLDLLRDRVHPLTAVYSLMGIWLIVAPWVVQNIDHNKGVVISNVVAGAVIALAGAAAAGLATLRFSRRDPRHA